MLTSGCTTELFGAKNCTCMPLPTIIIKFSKRRLNVNWWNKLEHFKRLQEYFVIKKGMDSLDSPAGVGVVET